MTTSLSLVLKQLDVGQKTGLINDVLGFLTENEQYELHMPYIDTFCELSTNQSEKNLDILKKYCIRILKLEDPSCHYNLIFKLLNIKDSKLADELINYVTDKLIIYLKTNPRHFNEKISKLIEIPSSVVDYELSNKYVLNLLRFLEWFFTNNETIVISNDKLNGLCYTYLTNEELEISKTCSKILKWRIESICENTELLWEIIFQLEKSKSNTEISYGYVLWLRFFNYFRPENLLSDSEFQKILNLEDYWTFLRNGLISLSHEHKKFSLTLTQMSVQSISTDISLPIMQWDVSETEEYIDSWKRFCTLYEILGIDAAMNQAQAATNDLLNIFSKNSKIPVSFSLTILSVGFKASMDKIKKFALKLTFSLPKESLSLFKHDIKFISNVFLPFTMKSSHFSVDTLDNGKKFHCEFGNQIRRFIANCISSLDDKNDVSSLASSIFNVISENRLTFGIARIYIIWGVLDGLRLHKGLVLNEEALKSLLSLFETTAEGDICVTTLHTIHLNILLQVDAQLVGLKSLIDALAYFIQINGWKFYAENEESFIDYFTTYFQKDEFVNLLNLLFSTEGFIVVLSYLASMKVDLKSVIPLTISYQDSYKLLVEMSYCGLSFDAIWKDASIILKIEQLTAQMVNGDDLEISIYSDSSKLFNNQTLFSHEFWDSVDVNFMFQNIQQKLINVDNMEEANYYIAQYKFFSGCFEKCIFNENVEVTLDDLVSLFTNALSKIPRGSDVTYYKAKDQLISYILSNVKALIKISQFDTTFRENVLELSNDVISISEYNSHLMNVQLIETMLSNMTENEPLVELEAMKIVEILELIWEDLVKDRLILSQRDLHQQYIELLLNGKLLVYSIGNERFANSLFKIVDQAITQSAGRKGIMPVLARAISKYQVEQYENFEKTLWLSKAIVKGVFLFQSELNIFQLDCLIADEYDKLLNITGDSLYQKVYGDAEISYHVTLYTIAASVRSSVFVNEIWSYIFENESIFHLLEPKKRTDREEQWKRLQFFSLFVITSEVIDIKHLTHYSETYLLKRLFKEASPLCRTYIEWILCINILRQPEFKDNVFKTLQTNAKTQQPLVVVTLEKISMLISMQLPVEKKTKFLTEFIVETILPTSSSNRALNRHFSTSLACRIYEEILKDNLDIDPLIMRTLSKISEDTKLNESPSASNYRTGNALLWDIKEDMNLVAITGGVLLKTTDREIDAIYENEYYSYLTKSQINKLRIPIGKDERDLWVKGERNADVKIESFYLDLNKEAEESSLLQTKSGVWSTVMELDDNVRAAAQVKRSDLIVVSSLVDKPPNLGGICRLCDVLGAGWMTVDDISVKNDQEFKTVAVTADRWMPLIEVKINEIAEFMKLKKKEGYTLIGLEQTDKSVELNSDLKFPKKSLILLGKEREGIPGDLLAELDMCVIIKQVGIVRSMNIQTATAVIVHAYSSQHC
ncbi:tRNA (guanosine(18)-2'-O)-methyltransferase [Pichia kluyveri]|uniref:tRNA (Guanosine(18)-2'-O)-methyltransferase n=1 Tax=Pichia kluyveri TaxID=36015 RepID=A0AAV5QXS9_PICKL|nr:tRNA (guanosine(18)-2'-O)-methyltransferase [Pichia kluyveri]